MPQALPMLCKTCRSIGGSRNPAFHAVLMMCRGLLRSHWLCSRAAAQMDGDQNQLAFSRRITCNLFCLSLISPSQTTPRYFARAQ
jgi:hypothetical protein